VSKRNKFKISVAIWRTPGGFYEANASANNESGCFWGNHLDPVALAQLVGEYVREEMTRNLRLYSNVDENPPIR
jgi:hypothetical protein